MYVHDQSQLRAAARRLQRYRQQLRRHAAGQSSAAEFGLALADNGLSSAGHGWTLAVALPHGMLTARQLRMLAYVARRWDKGYARLAGQHQWHFDWPRLEDTPRMLADLATAQLYPAQAGADLPAHHIRAPAYRPAPANPDHAPATPAFARWLAAHAQPHHIDGYAGVTIPLQAGRITADQMDALADLAQAYGHGELRAAPGSGLIFPDLPRASLFALWRQLDVLNLA
ncbi:hypothetical protein [Janthinobacterium agaricidamnosum]|uniref:Nitrite/Sulfite reductase ferredoxin-like half domain protein n=1 Tax=Janthinobacterium agaricidamnosum NBRC 102515 = DSM 9628 TaxID=1349767 RepID=W0V8Q4_9BURK|nr:hypothetical protein [Janthinobacterium agaricidamnosum]CDG83657.1 nitrite/Sulfite reductase ferredoxin-like half domain protein [Janthinobacterium agaricidamnosum NBRC 102515 = DSM 9628]